MILKKTIYYAVAVAALAAAATVCVVFLALALYAALAPNLGPAWSAAAVAAAALTVTVILSAVLLGKIIPHHPPGQQAQEPDLTMRVFELARDKPWVALGALGALGAAAAVAMKNPKITSAVITTLIASRVAKK